MENSSGQYQGATSEIEQGTHEKEMQDQRGQSVKEEDSYTKDRVACCYINSLDQDDVSSAGGNWLSYCSEMHENPGSPATETGRTSPTILSNDQICADRKESEGLLTEEETGGVRRESEVEGNRESAEGQRWDSKLDFPVCRDISVTNDGQNSIKLDVGFSRACRPLDVALASDTEQGAPATQHEINAISRCALHDSGFSTYCLEGRGTGSLHGFSASTIVDNGESVPSTEASRGPSRSVTIQMPSMLMSSMQSIHLDDVAVKGLSLDFISKASQHSEEEPLTPSVLGALKEEDKEVKEVSIQTERSRTKQRASPLFPFPPSFHRHSHLVKSASLDTGLHGEYRSCCYEPFHVWWAQQGGHCCPLSCHHCCSLQSIPLAPLCKPPVTCCSSHATLELQLRKTLKLLQDTAMRNVSSVSICSAICLSMVPPFPQ